MSIAKYENLVNDDGLELVVNTDTNLAYATQAAVVRMMGCPRQTIRDALKGGRNYSPIKAEVHTAGGVQGVQLYSADVVFDLAFKYNLPLAKKMGTAGANLYMLGLAGYKVKIEEDKTSDWKKVRVKGKQARKLFTDVLQANGASDMDYGYSTNVAYKGLLGMDASQIKIDRHVPKGKPARDGLTETELLLIQVIEHTTSKMVADGSGIRKVNEVINQQSSLAKLLIANISL